MRPKVSVIIPVYNVEKYIEQCIRSVMSQTLKEIEIIIVNDATPDNSMVIAEMLQKTDGRIKILNNPKNMWLGPTRNEGLRYASGEYVYFIDSDDWIEPETLKIAYNALKEYDAQFAAFGVRRTTKPIDQAQSDYSNQEIIVIEGRDKWFEKFAKREIKEFVWDKVYKTSFLKDNQFCFDKMITAEDIAFNLKLYEKIEKVIVVPHVFYNFRVNPDSLTQGKVSENHLKAYIDLICIVIKFLIKYDMIFTEYGKLFLLQMYAFAKRTIIRYSKQQQIQEDIIQDAVYDCFGKSKEGNVAYALLLGLCRECENTVRFLKSEQADVDSYDTYENARFVIEKMLAGGQIVAEGKIIIYGTGNWGKNFFRVLKDKEIQVIAFADSNEQKWGSELFGLKVISPSEIKEAGHTKILIASSYYLEISSLLDQLGFVHKKDYEYADV